MNYSHKYKKNILTFAALWIVSFAFIQIVSISTSLLNPYYFHYDSAYFQSVGKQWVAGFLPYRDFFDHKGPLIHLINACAYLTSYPRLSLGVIQAFSLCTTLFVLLKLFKEYMSLKRALLCLAVILAFWSFMFDGGNMTEEYCMPLSVLSLYLEFKWLKKYSESSDDPEYSHPAFLFFIDGLCVGIIFMINMKNAASIIIFDLCIAVLMLKDRKYQDFVKNALAAVAGAICPMILFSVYFAVNDAFYEMIKDAFLFVFSYASSRELTVPAGYMVIFSIPEILLLLTGVWCFYINRKLLGTVAIVWSVTLYAIFYTGFKHYFMSGIPLLAMAVVLIHIRGGGDKERNKVDRLFRVIFWSACFFVLLVAVIYLPRTMNTYSREAVEESKNCVAALQDSVSVIPENERDDVMVYNLDGLPMSFYIINELGMKFNHPYLTEFHMSYDPDLRDYTLNHIKKEKPLWIIIPEESTDPLITGYIKQNYELKAGYPVKMDIKMCKYDSDIQVWHKN